MCIAGILYWGEGVSLPVLKEIPGSKREPPGNREEVLRAWRAVPRDPGVWRWGARLAFFVALATWGERRRLGRGAGKDFSIEWAWPVGLQYRELGIKGEGNKPQNLVANGWVLSSAKPKPRLLTFWSCCTEGTKRILPGGQERWTRSSGPSRTD